MQFSASFGPACFLILAIYVGCDRILAVVMFTIGMACMGTFYCGMKVNSIDLTPNYAGSLMGLVNGVASITGFVGPELAGFITTEVLQLFKLFI